MRIFKSLTAGITALFGAIVAASAQAQVNVEGLDVIGAPVDGAMGWQTAATSVARDLQWLDWMLLVIITGITLFISALLVAVIVRYNRRANPVPATFTHNSPIEVTWTVVPIIILVFIGAFSLPVLFNQQEIPEGDVVIKATGYQWYWGYEYPDHELEFSSYMIGSPATLSTTDRPADADVTPYVLDAAMEQKLQDAGYSADEFLLAVDQPLVIPTGKIVVVQVTAADVIHSWTVPAFGVKQDGIPGRLAELWFKVDEGNEGIYFGQCSELCGRDHAYMPITVKAVTQAQYEDWLDRAIEAYAGTPRNMDVAAAE
jgi:cytochrome c oxidase subunit 2